MYSNPRKFLTYHIKSYLSFFITFFKGTKAIFWQFANWLKLQKKALKEY